MAANSSSKAIASFKRPKEDFRKKTKFALLSMPDLNDEILFQRLHSAVQNTRKPQFQPGLDIKDGVEVKLVPDVAVIAALRSMLGMRIYSISLNAAGTTTSSAAGSIKGGFSFDPATTSFAEYTTISALFDEGRAVAGHLTVATVIGSTGFAGAAGVTWSSPSFVLFAMCYDSINPLIPYGTLLRKPKCKHFNPMSHAVMSLSAKIPSNRLFEDLGTPSTANPPSGFLGAFGCDSISAFAFNMAIFNWNLRVDGQFRGRS